MRRIEYLSHLYWAFMALTVNEFKGACCWQCSGGNQPTCFLTGARLGQEFWQALLY